MSQIPYRAGPIPYPGVSLRIKDNLKDITFGPFECRVDSGADMSCIPRWVADRIAIYDYDVDTAFDFTGNAVPIELVVVLDATVEILDPSGQVVSQQDYSGLRLPIIADAEGLLGLDVLNDLVSTLDGPGLTLKI